MTHETLMQQLMRHEAFRGKPYTDSTGHTTIAYGRNLDDNPLTKAEGLMLLRHDIDRATNDLLDHFPFIGDMDQVRREVFINMVFNLGLEGFAGFRKMIAAAKNQDWLEAAAQLLDSRYAGQVGRRADELATQLRTGNRQA